MAVVNCIESIYRALGMPNGPSYNFQFSVHLILTGSAAYDTCLSQSWYFSNFMLILILLWNCLDQNHNMRVIELILVVYGFSAFNDILCFAFFAENCFTATGNYSIIVACLNTLMKMVNVIMVLKSTFMTDTGLLRDIADPYKAPPPKQKKKKKGRKGKNIYGATGSYAYSDAPPPAAKQKLQPKEKEGKAAYQGYQSKNLSTTNGKKGSAGGALEVSPSDESDGNHELENYFDDKSDSDDPQIE